MKSKILPLLLVFASVLLFSGCASNRTQYGKGEVNVLGGLVKVEEGLYKKRGPLTIGEKSSTFFPNADLDGDTVTLFWGLITYVDE